MEKDEQQRASCLARIIDPLAKPDLQAAAARPAECPRCGYDQRGLMSEWTSACPLEVTCPECGLRFEPAEVLSHKRCCPAWCIEASHGPMRVPRQFLATIARSAWPWRFWSQLRMSHEVRRPRLALFVALLLASGYVFFAVGQGIHMGRTWREWIRAGGLPAAGADVWISMLHAMALPLSDRSLALAKVPRPWATTLSPRRVLERRDFDDSRTIALGTFALAAAAVMPLIFVTIPVTRRQGHVRWRHLARIFIYSLPAALLPPWLLILCEPASPPIAFPLYWGLRLQPLLVPAALLVWWGVAIRRHLLLPHAWSMAACFTVIALGVVMVLGYADTVLNLMFRLAIDWGLVDLSPGG